MVFTWQEVGVWWERAQEVKDVVATVVAFDSLALDRRQKLNFFFFVIDDSTRKMNGYIQAKLLAIFMEARKRFIYREWSDKPRSSLH